MDLEPSRVGRSFSEAEQRETDPAKSEQSACGGRDGSKGCEGFGNSDRHNRTFWMTVILCFTISAQKWQEDARGK